MENCFVNWKWYWASKVDYLSTFFRSKEFILHEKDAWTGLPNVSSTYFNFALETAYLLIFKWFLKEREKIFFHFF